MMLKPGDKVQVMVACNDGRGIFRPRFELIEVHRADGAMVQLVCPETVVREYWASGRIASVRLGVRLMSCMGYAHRVGNLAWNSYVVHRLRAVAVLEDLRRRGATVDEVAVPAGEMCVEREDWWRLFSAPKASREGADGVGQVVGLDDLAGVGHSPEAEGAAVGAGVVGVDPLDRQRARERPQVGGQLGDVVAEGGLGAGGLAGGGRDGGGRVHGDRVGKDGVR